ncbi:hypothetical protein JAAARDRAFT_63994 [Jaapia argillacea MUCL 33604]|uniref:F-box domain-containing protein n=1 Tax=Jaapia argillacea MUCL 33604 TaxID=933084 RepID=A0A067QAU8_9AGAM|nr:hypothetical protein JAAARDRAFT_63994 [Jaapia argillacea MUCL 33604]
MWEGSPTRDAATSFLFGPMLRVVDLDLTRDTEAGLLDCLPERSPYLETFDLVCKGHPFSLTSVARLPHLRSLHLRIHGGKVISNQIIPCTTCFPFLESLTVVGGDTTLACRLLQLAQGSPLRSCRVTILVGRLSTEDYSALIAALSRRPTLKKVTLHIQRDLSSKEIVAMVLGWPNVEVLRLYGWHVDSLHDLVTIASGCKALQEIFLDRIDVQDAEVDSIISDPSPCSFPLRRLSIQDANLIRHNVYRLAKALSILFPHLQGNRWSDIPLTRALGRVNEVKQLRAIMADAASKHTPPGAV